MKDPAVLFYFQDFLVGTEFMTDDEVGKYIRILCHQADKGALTYTQLQRICRSDVPEAIMDKLTEDEAGNYYQKRMQIEKDKRNKHIEHQRNNANKRWNKELCDGNATAMPLENENEDINKDINRNKEEEKETFNNFRKEFPGTKRGNDSEFYNFVKKHKDWKEVLPLLLSRLNYQKEARIARRESKLFVPEWKNLQTWINNRCWEDKINTEE